MESGNVLAWSRFKGQFALVKVQNGCVRYALAWESEKEAIAYMSAQIQVAPQLRKMGTFRVIPMEIR